MDATNLTKYTKNDVFLIMFFNDTKYFYKMLDKIDLWVNSIDNVDIRLLISDYIKIKNYGYNFRTFFDNNFPTDFKNEMLLYFGKHAVILSDENFEHMMNKVIAK